MEVTVFTVFFAIILIIQVPPIIKRKNIREILAYSFMMLSGMVYFYAYILNVELPTPINAINVVFTPLTKLLEQILGAGRG